MAEQGAKQERPPLPTRKLRVVEYDQIGKTTKGAPIYKVKAVHEDGSLVEEELRAFQELPVGEVVEYALKRYDHEKYGESYTLYPPKEKLGTRVARLEDRITELESRLEAVEQQASGVASAPADDLSF